MKLKAKITVFIRRIKQKMTCLNFMADWREEVQTVFYDQENIYLVWDSYSDIVYMHQFQLDKCLQGDVNCLKNQKLEKHINTKETKKELYS